MLNANGQVRDLSGVLDNITANTLLPASLEKGVVAGMPGGGLLGSSALIKTADQLHA